MDDIDLARSLRGALGGGTTTRRVSSPTTTTTISGTATGDSANGVVSVRIDGQGTGTDDDGSTEIATTANVREGDRVIVNLVGADGTGKSPVVTGVVGGADRQQGEIDGAVRTAMTASETADAASTAAGEAKTIAEATGQHVWDDESGLHVTEVEREDYEQTPTGFARLMTSAGELLTRAVEGVEKLLRSDTASGTVYYDGECAPDAQDLEDHIIAAFDKDEVVLGKPGAGKTQVKIYNDTTYGDAGFLVTNTDDQGVTSGTYIERGRLSVGGPNYDESNHEEFVATHQLINLTEGWQAPEVGMGNRDRGGAMFYGFDTNFNPTVNYRVDWNGNISTTGTITGASVGDANGTLADLRDSVSQASPGYTFTPYSGFTILGSYVQRFGRLMILSVEVGTSTARAAGQVNVGKWSCTNLGGLGAARIATATANTAYEGVCQLAGTGEMRFYSSTANATKFWGVVMVMA